ncbi:hypothetical protein IFM89_037749 [Coptis chinensis]|uniref:Uncharacterized protein n=1 Tax=Coptis chinensis TaxID=261450 RepID=A0A835M831_9MAGN|nr:hypothetical protein IFM89_037749 [Coptis chinensis]
MKDLAGIDEHGTQLPLSDEIYREVMMPRAAWTCEVEGTRCNPNRLLWLSTILDNRVNDTESRLAEMQKSSTKRRRRKDDLRLKRLRGKHKRKMSKGDMK